MKKTIFILLFPIALIASLIFASTVNSSDPEYTLKKYVNGVEFWSHEDFRTAAFKSNVQLDLEKGFVILPGSRSQLDLTKGRPKYVYFGTDREDFLRVVISPGGCVDQEITFRQGRIFRTENKHYPERHRFMKQNQRCTAR